MMDRGYQHNLKDKLQSETEMKLTETEVRARGVVPYMGYIGTCRGIGYGFLGSRSLNRVSF